MSLYEVKLMPQAQKDRDNFSGKLLSRFEDVISGLYEINDLKKDVKVYRIAHRIEGYR